MLFFLDVLIKSALQEEKPCLLKTIACTEMGAEKGFHLCGNKKHWIQEL